MEGLLTADYGEGVQLFCYADDLALVFNHRASLQQAPHALARLEGLCKELGLKLSFGKSEAILFGASPPQRDLLLGGQPLLFVTAHQYLGVWLDSRLRFTAQVRYLKERSSSRTKILRALSSRNAGASYKVLRAFYIHAARSIIDYCAPCLCSLSPALLKKLEVAQNDALRVILGAPPWTRVANLRAECNLPSLHHRILARTSSVVGKFLKFYPRSSVSTQLLNAFGRPLPNSPDGDWVHDAVAAVRHLGGDRTVTSGHDLLHPDFLQPPPWQPSPLHFSLPSAAAPKSFHPGVLRLEALQYINSFEPDSTAHYFSDGSLGTDGTAGAAFVCVDDVELWRLPTGVSILQAELVAILKALRHARQSPARSIVIHSDSLSALLLLESGNMKDNVFLVSSILHESAFLVSQGKGVHLHWVPSHVGIRGNERADHEACRSRLLPHVTFPIAPSMSCIKRMASKAALLLTRRGHAALLEQGSQSVSWYATATRLQPISLPASTPNTVITRLRRLRLGFPCFSQINGLDNPPCEHCLEATTDPLLHYLLACPATTGVRRAPPNYIQDEDMAVQAAAEAIYATSDTILARMVQLYPPPR